MKKIVFSGGTHGGKTTIVEHYAQRGYVTVPEVAIEYINELNEAKGLEGQKQWRKENQAVFFEQVAERQIKKESMLDTKGEEKVFFDRSGIDLIGFLLFYGLDIPEILVEYATSSNLDSVFICETLSSFEIRPETGRMVTKEEAVRITDCVAEAYARYGYTPYILKDMPFGERIQYIDEKIGF